MDQAFLPHRYRARGRGVVGWLLNTGVTFGYDLLSQGVNFLVGQLENLAMLKSLLAAAVAFSFLSSFARAAEGSGSGPLAHTVKDIDGKDVDLSKYKGKVVM